MSVDKLSSDVSKINDPKIKASLATKVSSVTSNFSKAKMQFESKHKEVVGVIKSTAPPEFLQKMKNVQAIIDEVFPSVSKDFKYDQIESMVTMSDGLKVCWSLSCYSASLWCIVSLISRYGVYDVMFASLWCVYDVMFVSLWCSCHYYCFTSVFKIFFQAKLKDLNDQEDNLKVLSKQAKEFNSTLSPESALKYQKEVSDINRQWTDCKKITEARLQRINEAVLQTKELETAMKETINWMDDVDKFLEEITGTIAEGDPETIESQVQEVEVLH